MAREWQVVAVRLQAPYSDRAAEIAEREGRLLAPWVRGLIHKELLRHDKEAPSTEVQNVRE